MPTRERLLRIRSKLVFFCSLSGSGPYWSLMKPRLEPRPPRLSAQSLLAFHRVEAAFPFEWHYHGECELTWIEAGEGTRYVGDTVEPYVAGDLVLLGGNLPHTWSSERPVQKARAHRAVVVQFQATIFDHPGPEFAAVRHLLARLDRGLRFPTDAIAPRTWLELTTLRGLEAWCALARLLDQLAHSEGATPIASPGYLPAPRHGSRKRYERALAFVAQQAEAGPVYLRDAARVVHLSPAAFSRFFQRFSGETFVRHVNGLRIAKAARLLAETDQPVATIAFACGFGNLSNFNRRFRALKGLTPLAWRSRFSGPDLPTETSRRRRR